MIFVTGATGFLGSELVKQLLERGKRVRALKRRNSSIPSLLKNNPSLEWVEGDMLDFFSLEKALEDVTEVYHCAAIVSFDTGHKKKMLAVNKEGTGHLVQLCLERNVRKLIHVSSVAALGDGKAGDLTHENNHWEFDGNQYGYSISKYESEMEVWRGIAEGLRAVIVNPSVIIGKNAGNEGSGKLFTAVEKGLRFYTDGATGFVDVEDVARAMIMLMESDIHSERFILNSENMRFKDFFRITAAALGTKAPGIKVTPWMMVLGRQLAGLVSLVSGKRTLLTREVAVSALKSTAYSSSKFLKRFPDFEFKPIQESIAEICRERRSRMLIDP